MITLTTPEQIRSKIGATTKISYERMSVTRFAVVIEEAIVSGEVRFTSTSTPGAQPLYGEFRMKGTGATVEAVILAKDAAMFPRTALSAPQAAAVVAAISAMQAQIENGIIAFSLVDGVRADGL